MSVRSVSGSNRLRFSDRPEVYLGLVKSLNPPYSLGILLTPKVYRT